MMVMTTQRRPPCHQRGAVPTPKRQPFGSEASRSHMWSWMFLFSIFLFAFPVPSLFLFVSLAFFWIISNFLNRQRDYVPGQRPSVELYRRARMDGQGIIGPRKARRSGTRRGNLGGASAPSLWCFFSNGPRGFHSWATPPWQG